jgi:hypothetical protein
MRTLSLHICLFVLAVSAAVGCGGGDKPLVPVSGQVTYAGGSWPMTGTITLTPISAPEGQPSRPGSATFNTDGKFVIGSYKPGDGLRPGTYGVIISCYDPATQQGRPQEEVDLVPASFKADNVVVEKGQDAIVLKYDVPKKQ